MNSENNRTYYYARVSSGEQNLDRQLDAFRKLGADDEFIVCDKQSGKDIDRRNYRLLRDKLLRTGDTLVVKSLDRLSRNKADIKNELEYYKSIAVRVKVIDLPTTMAEVPDGQDWILEMVNNIIIEVLSSIAEQERSNIRERQREGIEAAKLQGKHLGRPTAKYPPNWEQVYSHWKSGYITAADAIQQTGQKRTTFYKLVKQYEK